MSELLQKVQDYQITLTYSLIILTVAQSAAQKYDNIDHIDHVAKLLILIDEYSDTDEALERVGLSSESVVKMVEIARTPEARRVLQEDTN